MAGVTTKSVRSSAVAPLTSEQAARADHLARRLHGVLAALVETLPDHARGASGMSRHLSVVRNTCQRVVSALADPPAIETLTTLPGVRGIEQFLEGFEKIDGDAATIASAATAVRQFDDFLTEIGGSQSKLAERIERSSVIERDDPTHAPNRAAAKAREALCAAAAQVVGRQCDVKVSLYIFRDHPTDSRLERVLAQGEIGQLVGAEPMPFAFRAGDTRHKEKHAEGKIFASLDKTPAHGSTPNAILNEFCSDPLPLVTSRDSEGHVVQMVDASALPDGHPTDVIIANRSVHPGRMPDTGKSSFDEVWTLMFYPARHLIFDVYLHRDMERRFRPTIDSQLWSPNLDTHPADRWVTRFPHGPRLQLIGRSFNDARSDAYPRHVDLTRHLFDRVGWDHSEYVGFRCEVEFPIWRGGYCIRFEPVEEPSAEK